MNDTSCGVAVFVRFRPINKREENEGGQQKSSAIVIGNNRGSVKCLLNNSKPLDFQFDDIFDGNCTQGI